MVSSLIYLLITTMLPILTICMIEVLIIFILWKQYELGYKIRTLKGTIPLLQAFNIAHRGGGGESYENTIGAFHHALAVGADMLEMDIRMTRDGLLVVFHDTFLKRTTGFEGCVEESLLSELPKLKEVIESDTEQGRVYNFPKKDRAIPTFDDVLRTFPNTPMHLDVCGPPPMCCKVKEAILNFHDGNNIVWGSVEFSLCPECYYDGRLPFMFFSPLKILLTTVAGLTGLLPFIPIRETHFSVVLPGVLHKVSLNWDCSTFNYSMVYIISYLATTRRVITQLRGMGVQIWLWTVNTEKEFEECLNTGADGIFTDYPTRLNAWVTRRHRMGVINPNLNPNKDIISTIP